MFKIEALADAIAEYTGYRNPQSTLYRLRNPGGLKAVSPKHIADEAGHRLFIRHLDGYRALIYDLGEKCSGRSSCGLTKDSPLTELVRVFWMKDDTTRYIVRFLRKALDKDDLDEKVPIGWFVEES